MLKIIEGRHVSAIDKAFVERSGISSWTLMERAATSFTSWFMEYFPEGNQRIVVFCGKGNNGGDGLAIARLLNGQYAAISVVLLNPVEEGSKDFQDNLKLLPQEVNVFIASDFHWNPEFQDIIIDCIFGVGINAPLKGLYLEVVRKINTSKAIRVAVDLPSGLPADAILNGEAVHAHHTFTFHFPKISLLLPDHAVYTGLLHIGDIGVPNEMLETYSKGRYYLGKSDIVPLHKTFHRFSHKGDFGKVLVAGGSSGKMGAVLLTAKAALRSGSGLVYCLVPDEGRLVLQVAAPEVMVSNPTEAEDIAGFDAIAVGPGWGSEHQAEVLQKYFSHQTKPMVIDADGLNILARFPELLKSIPKNSILTPHLKEFERLAGTCSDHLERLQRAKEFAMKYQAILVLKGANTCITSPGGEQYFNSTGNQYMATAGSGDVLTGIIVSFLGQGYNPLDAALCAVFHHGLAGELASRTKLRGLIAFDIIEAIPATFLELGIR
jgi:ADP-dependent NAD(P)H-hydrate dehydratase / NAD(P)H-hydrate epimerase